MPARLTTAADPATAAGRPSRWLLVRFFGRESGGLVALTLSLFLPAGRLDWPMGWALVAITGLWVGATGLVLALCQPELIAERLGPKPGTKRWDLVILSLLGLLAIIRNVVAGQAVRAATTVAPPSVIQVGALLVAVGGYGLMVWALAVNAFFASTARIQTERGQTVATGGPYRWVRHPGYLGLLLADLAVPVMLGSGWALVPGALSAGLVVVRTRLEDRMLQDELAGYPAYAERVRSRLLPGLW